MKGDFLQKQHSIVNHGSSNTTPLHSCLLPSEGFTIRFDPGNQYVAIGCNDGTRLLYSMKDNNIAQRADCPNQEPVTCVKWRPMVNTHVKVLGVTNTMGQFDYLHIPSMKKLFSIEEKDNSLHCCDFSTTGQHFATGGKDCHVRIYDQNTKTVTTDLAAAQWNNRGHSNRVFSVKFIDDNTLISGGWDSVLHLWDIREGKSVNSVYGPHVAGDAIDIKKGELLVGCYSAKNQVQIWDLKTLTQRQSISWSNEDSKEKVPYVYSANFANYEDGTILAGSCGVNEVKAFHREGGNYSPATTISGLGHGCFSVDSSFKEKVMAFSTAKEGFFVYKMAKK